MLDVDALLLDLPGEVTDLSLPLDVGHEQWFAALHKKAALEHVPLDDDELALVKGMNKWTGMSLMQKGVRRRLWKPTMMAVHGLCSNGYFSDCVRRLKVIALEDVGNGDPMAAALAQLILNSTPLRKQWDQTQLALMAARVLCFSWKSRALCDLEVWMGMEPTCFERIKEMQAMSVQQVKDAVLDENAVFVDRMLAFARLWPLKAAAPNKGMGVYDRMDVYAEMGMSASMVYASEACFKSTGSTMGIGLPMMSRFMGDVYEHHDHWLADNWAHKGLLAAALDKHTSRGKASINKWSKLPPLSDWFAAHPHVDQYGSIMRAEFYVSASVLEPVAQHEGSADLYWQILDLKCQKTGFQSLDEVVELFDLAYANMQGLNSLRFGG